MKFKFAEFLAGVFFAALVFLLIFFPLLCGLSNKGCRLKCVKTPTASFVFLNLPIGGMLLIIFSSEKNRTPFRLATIYPRNGRNTVIFAVYWWTCVVVQEWSRLVAVVLSFLCGILRCFIRCEMCLQSVELFSCCQQCDYFLLHTFFQHRFYLLQSLILTTAFLFSIQMWFISTNQLMPKWIVTLLN